jgi:hypothetical protein
MSFLDTLLERGREKVAQKVSPVSPVETSAALQDAEAEKQTKTLAKIMSEPDPKESFRDSKSEG